MSNEMFCYLFFFLVYLIIQRRWIVVSNPTLCGLISKWLGTEAWIRDVDLLIGLKQHAENPQLQHEWKMVCHYSHIPCLCFLFMHTTQSLIKKKIAMGHGYLGGAFSKDTASPFRCSVVLV